MSERESVKCNVRGSEWNLRLPLGQQLGHRTYAPTHTHPSPCQPPLPCLGFPPSSFWLRLSSILPAQHLSVIFSVIKNSINTLEKQCVSLLWAACWNSPHLCLSIFIKVDSWFCSPPAEQKLQPHWCGQTPWSVPYQKNCLFNIFFSWSCPHVVSLFLLLYSDFLPSPSSHRGPSPGGVARSHIPAPRGAVSFTSISISSSPPELLTSIFLSCLACCGVARVMDWKLELSNISSMGRLQRRTVLLLKYVFRRWFKNKDGDWVEE